MKKLYEIPAIELTKFDVEDVITASSAYDYVQNPTAFKESVGAEAVAMWSSSWNDDLGI